MGPRRWACIAELVGSQQLLYGSDRPVVEPDEHGMPARLDWEPIAECTRRALGVPSLERGEMSVTSLHPVIPAIAPQESPVVDRSGLAGVPRPLGRDLSGPELEAFVSELADRPELWIDLVKHDSTQRVYEELISDEHRDRMAHLLDGRARHRLPRPRHLLRELSPSSAARCARSAWRSRGHPQRGLSRGSEHSTSPPSDIHRVSHAGTDPAVTLHVYSPPLLRMGAYVIGEDGVLARHPMSYERGARARATGRTSRTSLGACYGARTPPSPAIRIRLTSSGANRPCSTTPGVPLSLAESSRGSPTGPR